MAEQTPTSTEQTATPAATEQSSPMEQVYKEYNIEETAQEFQPARPEPQPQATPTYAPKVPDPFDPNFQNYMAQTAHSVSALTHTLRATQGQLSQMQSQLARERTEADIAKATEVIAKEAEVDPDVAHVAMEVRARKDPKFLNIWNNRAKNPSAYNAALKALAKETGDKYRVRQDPQLVENQRAVKASQQQMATTTKQSDNDKWTDMTPADRQREIRRLITSGG